jgi:hypothetical protein
MGLAEVRVRKSVLLVAWMSWALVSCGDRPQQSSSPADPSRAPAATGTQAGHVEAVAATTSDAAPVDVDKAMAGCQSALDAHPVGGGSGGATAPQLNTAGFRCYQAGKLAEAVHFFTLAVRENDRHALAHYNLACTLALLRRAGAVCAHGATVDVILTHLERAVELDADRRRRMREDDDLADVRSTLRYRVLDGGNLRDRAQQPALLSGIVLYSPPQGAFGNLSTLTLMGAGDGSASSIARVSVRTVTDSGVSAPRTVDGTWSVSNGKVTVNLPDDLTGGGNFSLSPKGNLMDSTKRGLDAIAWFAAASECDA